MRQNPTHTDSLIKAGMEGIQERGRKREEREGDGRGGEEIGGGGGGEQEQEKMGVKAALHTQWGGEALSSTGCFFQEENRSGPHCCALPLRTEGCVSPHTLLLSLPTACWQAQESTRSDSHALCIHQARSICVHGLSSCPQSPHTQPLR